MRNLMSLVLLGGVAGAALITASAFGQQGQTVTPPKARYAMDVGTSSGFGAGGRAPSLGSILGGEGGGGGSVVHELRLRLGSSLPPAGGAAKADHFFQPAAGLGPSVPLHWERQGTAPGEVEYQRPKGKLLIYWGCGERAGPGQPVVIDFAKIAAGQAPPGLFSTNVPADRGPMPTNSKTYGEWPNVKSTRQVTAQSSLIGDHRIAGSYSPEIKFALTQDYMAGLTARSAVAPSGAVNLSWNGLPNATGYYAWAFGAKGMGDRAPEEMVWWTSSVAKEFGGGLWDWLPPETVRKLIASKVVMPPTQTSCTVPAEVRQAAPEFMMGNLFAYGPEANFVYPPRPANPRTPWNQEWTARVRYRSNTSFLVGGPDLSGLGGDESASAESGTAEQPKKKCKKRGGLGGLGGLGGMIGGALGGGKCE